MKYSMQLCSIVKCPVEKEEQQPEVVNKRIQKQELVGNNEE